jgi:hypothetical protein
MDHQLWVVPVLVLHHLLIAVGNLLNRRPIIEACSGVDVEAERGEVVGLGVLDGQQETTEVVLLELELELDLKR